MCHHRYKGKEWLTGGIPGVTLARAHAWEDLMTSRFQALFFFLWCSECQPYFIILFAQTRFVPSVAYYVATDRVCVLFTQAWVYIWCHALVRARRSFWTCFCTGRLEIESSCSYPETAFCGLGLWVLSMRGKTLFLCNFRAASRGVAGATLAKRPVGMKEEPQNY